MRSFTFDISDALTSVIDEHVVFVLPTELQRNVYQHILNAPGLDEALAAQHLVLIGTLRSLCNSPGLLWRKMDKVMSLS